MESEFISVHERQEKEKLQKGKNNLFLLLAVSSYKCCIPLLKIAVLKLYQLIIKRANLLPNRIYLFTLRSLITISIFQADFEIKQNGNLDGIRNGRNKEIQNTDI